MNDNKINLSKAYIRFKTRHMLLFLHVLFGFSIVFFFGGLIAWPFYGDGWKFALSAIPLFTFHYLLNIIYNASIDKLYVDVETILRNNDSFWNTHLEQMRKDKNFVKHYKPFYSEYLVDFQNITDEQIAQLLIGKTLSIDNETTKLTKLPQVIYYLGEIKNKPKGFESIRFVNGFFTDQSECGQTLKQYITDNI